MPSPEQPDRPSYIMPPDFAPPGEIVWSNDHLSHTPLSTQQLLEISHGFWETERYGQLAAAIAPFQAHKLGYTMLWGVWEEPGLVLESEWRATEIVGKLTFGATSFGKMESLAGARLARLGLLQSVNLVAGDIMPLKRDLLLDVRLGAMTRESVQSSMFHRFGGRFALTGALGKAVDTLAIAAGVRSEPRAPNLQPFEPDDSWVAFDSIRGLAIEAGLTKQQAAMLCDKIETLLLEQLWTGRSLPFGEVRAEGDCSLTTDKYSTLTAQYIHRDSFKPLAAEYRPRANDLRYRLLMAFLSKMFGAEIHPLQNVPQSNRRQRQAAKGDTPDYYF